MRIEDDEDVDIDNQPDFQEEYEDAEEEKSPVNIQTAQVNPELPLTADVLGRQAD